MTRGRQLRTPTYIDDCVAGIIAAIERGADGRTYNVAGPEDIRLAEIPRRLGRLLGRPVACRLAAQAPGDPRVATVSGERAARELGYAPRIDVAAGLAAQLDAWAGTAAAPAARSAVTS